MIYHPKQHPKCFGLSKTSPNIISFQPRKTIKPPNFFKLPTKLKSHIKVHVFSNHQKTADISNPTFLPQPPGVETTRDDAMSVPRRGPVPNGGGRHEKSVQFRQYDLETWISLTLRISHWTLEAWRGEWTWMNLYFVGVFVPKMTYSHFGGWNRILREDDFYFYLAW